jgi:adenosine deaminase
MFSSPLAGEYELARETFHLSDDNLADIARNGICACFTDDSTKMTFLMAVDNWQVQEAQ